MPSLDRSPVAYAKNGDVSLAYQFVGDPQADRVILYLANGFFPIESWWDFPLSVSFFERLAGLGCVLLTDRRGVGSSDPISPDDPGGPEDWCADAAAVLDAARVERAVVFGDGFGAYAAQVLAAEHPERVSHLVLFHAVARGQRCDDYPYGLTEAEASALVESMLSGGDQAEALEREPSGPPNSLFVPSAADDVNFADWSARAGRMGASPRTAQAMYGAFGVADVRPYVERIAVPTLVAHRSAVPVFELGHAEWLHAAIPGSRLVVLDGADLPPFLGDMDELLAAVEEFVTGARSGPAADRVLATLLFTDIVGSTDRASEVGDRRWREALDRHDEIVDRELRRYGGRIVNPTGDGVLAEVDSPSRAIGAAAAIRDAVRSLGLEIRAGVHTGEVERRGTDLGGVGVNIAARVMGVAGAGEILVSGAVPILVTGSGISFTDHGTHTLKGVPGTWAISKAEV